MWDELGISGGTAVIILIALYFIIKWAVKSGVKEAYKRILPERKQLRILKLKRHSDMMLKISKLWLF